MDYPHYKENLRDINDTLERIAKALEGNFDVRREGHWCETYERSGLFFCSECKFDVGKKGNIYTYCPNCGVRMYKDNV